MLIDTVMYLLFFFQAEDGIRDKLVTGVQTCALPISVGAIVRRGFKAPGKALLIEVEDPLCAFQELARAHRRRFGIPVVAVSGSNGKTTTKEMIGAILAEAYPTLKTDGNLNNHIGVPQTLLRLAARHEAAVIEMGISRLGEMARLCEIAEDRKSTRLNSSH